VQGDHDVQRLEVAMDHSFLVGMLHGLANMDEQFQPSADVQTVLVAEVRDRCATN
jgi:hypothetical protein